jgi:alkyl sulfatase BDS1-like metallo-beta-lactamase superfamily hydrolase
MFATGDTTSPGVEMAGDATAMSTLLGVLDRPDPSFNIITP